ncbi:MAG: AAA domain-containing protein [Dehalococcoidia bacterium]|nr:AAA domain-containing protein [Dehalococcoidia bacterium]
MAVDIEAINARVKQESRLVDAVREEVGRVIVGQQYLIDRLLIALLCDGHILIEGVPGLAKTLSVHTLAQTIGASFVRIQFTPDLLPADVTGTQIYNPQAGEFHTRKGPLFANIILADEVNRAPAKVQSALLEAMQERQVSIGGTTYPLPAPFMVLATQNPIESEGTYPLPEAQLDRFMLKAVVHYPTLQEERVILERYENSTKFEVSQVVSLDELMAARSAVQEVHLNDQLRGYIVHLIQATRDPRAYRMESLAPLIAFGASPRATIYLAQAAKAHAFIDGRGYVMPDDVKGVAKDVMRHRVIITYEAEAENLTPDEIIDRVLQGVAVP